MDKKTKFYLKNIIKESISTDVDEMADRPKGTRYIWGDPKTPPFKNRPVWSRDNPTEPGGKSLPKFSFITLFTILNNSLSVILIIFFIILN